MNAAYTPYDEAAIARERRAGASYAEIMAGHGIGHTMLQNILRKNGLPVQSPRMVPQVPDEAQARICELRDAGLSERAIADETGWSRGAVRRTLTRRRSPGYDKKATPAILS